MLPHLRFAMMLFYIRVIFGVSRHYYFLIYSPWGYYCIIHSFHCIGVKTRNLLLFKASSLPVPKQIHLDRIKPGSYGLHVTLLSELSVWYWSAVYFYQNKNLHDKYKTQILQEKTLFRGLRLHWVITNEIKMYDQPRCPCFIQ